MQCLSFRSMVARERFAAIAHDGSSIEQLLACGLGQQPLAQRVQSARHSIEESVQHLEYLEQTRLGQRAHFSVVPLLALEGRQGLGRVELLLDPRQNRRELPNMEREMPKTDLKPNSTSRIESRPCGSLRS